MPFQSHDIKRNTASNDSRQDTSMFRLSNKEFQLEQALQSPTWIQEASQSERILFKRVKDELTVNDEQLREIAVS